MLRATVSFLVFDLILFGECRAIRSHSRDYATAACELSRVRLQQVKTSTRTLTTVVELPPLCSDPPPLDGDSLGRMNIDAVYGSNERGMVEPGDCQAPFEHSSLPALGDECPYGVADYSAVRAEVKRFAWPCRVRAGHVLARGDRANCLLALLKSAALPAGDLRAVNRGTCRTRVAYSGSEIPPCRCWRRHSQLHWSGLRPARSTRCNRVDKPRCWARSRCVAGPQA